MLEIKLKNLPVLCLVLGLAFSAIAEDVNWTGNSQYNDNVDGLYYWDLPGNWDTGTVPTLDDKVIIQNVGDGKTLIVDDLDPNLAKEGADILFNWGGRDQTLWVKSYDGTGPGGVLTCGRLQLPPGGANNVSLLVDAGEVNADRIFINPWVNANNGDPNSSGNIIVNGGTVNVNELRLSNQDFPHSASLIVNGGEVNVNTRIFKKGSSSIAQILLNGGILTAKKLEGTDNLSIDVNEGSLVLDGDQSDLISQLVASGQLSIAGQTAQRGGLFVVYDAESGKTNINADPSLVKPNNAWAPLPKDTTLDVPADTALLAWSAGDMTAASAGHAVYLGVDSEAVANDSTDNALGTYQGTVDDAEMLIPIELMLGQTYYWRVDQIAEDATVYNGRVWSFTVSESVLIDDFEDYDNQDPNEIFNTWKDGVDVADNGMQVGYWDPNYAETTIVKQASQSMPLFYDNNDVVLNSEAKRTFDSAQDWTKYGVKSLSLMFRGEPDNTFGTVYIKINDEKKTYPLSASHMQFAQWKPWIIDLNDIDVINVTSLAIGVDGVGSGTLYIDDIRLYDQEAQLMPAPDSGVEPNEAALVAHYLFDGNAEDGSGNGHHGTVATGGIPNWVDGVFDGALDFSQMYGLGCGDFDPTGGTGKFTLTLWCYWEGGLIQHLVTKSTGWAADTMMFQIELKGSDSWIAEQDRNRLNLAYQGSAQAGFDRVPTHEWVHLALTFDGEQATGYLNGIDSVGPKATGIGPNVAASVILGATETGERVLQGLMDDVRIYNYALTPEEVIGTIGVDLGFKPF